MATINLQQGDDATITIDFDVDITGGTVYFVIKKYKSDADASALISKTISSHTNAAAGTTQATITDQESKVIPQGMYYWMAQLKNSSGLVSSARAGIVNIREKVKDAQSS